MSPRLAPLAGACLALVLDAAPAAAGGGWVPERGASWIEFALLHARTGETYDDAGGRLPFRRVQDVDRATTYRDDALVLFAEAGLGHGLAVDGDVAFKRVVVDEPATRFRAAGPGDARLRLKRGFRAGALAWAVSAEAKVPLDGGRDTDYPALGSGAIDGAVHAHAGLGLGRGYAQAEVGLRRRGGPARDEWPFAAQGGARVLPAWTVLLDVRGHGRFGGGDGTGAGADFDPATASSSVVQGGPGLMFAPARGLRLSAQAWRSLSGRNMPAGWKWKLALARVR